MAKKKPLAALHEPLSVVFGTQAKVVVLRILAATAVALPFREIARRSGMAYRSVDLALADLLSSGLVEELPGGRERRVRMRAGHRLTPVIAALLRSEADFYPSLRAELRAIGAVGEKEGLLALALVGATAERVERVGEAIELVLVGVDQSAASRWQARLEAASPGLAERFGVTCRLICYDLEGAQRLWRTRTARAEAMVRGAERLAGTPLLDLMESI